MSGQETRAIARPKARHFLQRATEFLEAARLDLEMGRWNAAGLAAIHAGISAGDATLIASAGLRSVSSDHRMQIKLLERHVPDCAANQRRQLAGLLKMKNGVEYEARLLTEIEARQLVDHARRLVSWADNVVRECFGNR